MKSPYDLETGLQRQKLPYAGYLHSDAYKNALRGGSEKSARYSPPDSASLRSQNARRRSREARMYRKWQL